MRVAVVGHVEWVEFLRVEEMPAPGDIIHVSDFWEEPAGGGPGAAAQLRKLAGSCTFFTALGDDEFPGDQVYFQGHATPGIYARAFLEGRIDEHHLQNFRQELAEGGGLSSYPHPYLMPDFWQFPTVSMGLGPLLSIYQARFNRYLRARGLAQGEEPKIWAFVGDGETDESERYETGNLQPTPHVAVLTRGREGGRFSVDGGEWRTFPATPLPGPVVDSYGAGDSFAAGLAYGLAALGDPERAIELAARCGAAVLTGRGPYAGQLTAPDP